MGLAAIYTKGAGELVWDLVAVWLISISLQDVASRRGHLMEVECPRRLKQGEPLEAVLGAQQSPLYDKLGDRWLRVGL